MSDVFLVGVGEYDDYHVDSIWAEERDGHKRIDDLKAAPPANRNYGETYPAALRRITLNEIPAELGRRADAGTLLRYWDGHRERDDWVQEQSSASGNG